MNNENNNLFSEGFEVEGQDKTITEEITTSPFDLDETNEVTEKTRNVEALQINSDIEVKTFDIAEFKIESDELLSLSKKIIQDDIDNNSARDIGKQLTKLVKQIDDARLEANKPDQAKINKRMADAKTIIVPASAEVERLKKAISFYESEKERKRLLELKRIEDEKKAKEEAEKKERERVAKIKSAIERIRTEGIARLEKCNTLAELNSFETNVNGFVLKTDFYQEFISEAENEKTQLIILVSQRKPLLEEIEKQKLEAAKLEGEQKEAANREAEAKQKEFAAQKLADEEKRKNEELVKQNNELNASRDLMMFAASLDLTDAELYINKVIEKYGSAYTAMQDREKLIDDYKQSLIEKSKEEAVTAGKVKNVRTDFDFKIVSETEIPDEFWSVDEAKIKKYILSKRAELEKDVNSVSIKGLIIFPRRSTILK